MPNLYPSTIVLDVHDLRRAARFWGEALGYIPSYESESFVALKHPEDPKRFRIGFQPAEGPKRDANRVHLDLATDDMEREAKRLEAFGATRAKDWDYGEANPNWIVLRDPEGNEFCVVQHPEERLLYRDASNSSRSGV